MTKDRKSLQEHTAIVTGGSGGIGRAICRRLAADGAKVIVHYEQAQATAEAVAEGLVERGGSARAVRADLGDPNGAQRLFEETVAAVGHPTILVNNAAIQPASEFEGISVADMSRMLAVNVSGPFRLIQLFAEQVAAHDRKDASVVNIASIEGTRPALAHSHYAVSKAALIMATRACALELGQKNIRVNSVSPGLIDREGLERDWPDGVERWMTSAPLRRLGTAEDVANAVGFLVSAEAGWITGHDLVVDGGLSARPGW